MRSVMPVVYTVKNVIMKHKRIASICGAVTYVALCVVMPNMIAYSEDKQKYVFNSVNCSNLRNDPRLCLLNNTNLSVAAIDCEANKDSGTPEIEIPLPKGGIPAHSIAVVDMKSCNAPVSFTMDGGSTRHIGITDTNKITTLDVPNK